MNVTPISISPTDGPVSVRISIPNNPQTVAGKVFQYSAAKVMEQTVGIFDFEHTDLLLGMPSTITGKFFAVSGLVLFLGDSTPSFYQVVVEVLQNGQSIFKEVPKTGGAGTLKDADIPFIYGFTIQ
ncbi:hypothetical protein [Spirosoma litoris]